MDVQHRAPVEQVADLAGGPDSIGTPAPLAHDEVRRKLVYLTDWSGDEKRLRRTITRPPDEIGGLCHHLERVLEVSGQGGEVVQEDGVVTVDLRDELAGGVTSYHIALAQRIDDVLLDSEPSEATPSCGPAPEVLFGGVGLRGWRMCGEGGFDIAGGVLRSHGGMGLLWYSERQFTDFVLALDWQVERVEDNAGVFVRFSDPGDDPWAAVLDGYEVQLYDAGSGDEGTGALYRVAAPHTDVPVNPPGEWNHLEVEVAGESYRVGVNGRAVTSYVNGRRRSGFVGLQNHDHGSTVAYRNVLVYEG